jgi:hypothetical protein
VACPGSRGVGASTRAAPIEPLSAGRYKVTFTAGAELKTKLELARDLLRHAVPSGDYAAIVGRALDLLLEEVKRRRFGSNAKKAEPSRQAAPSPRPSTRPACREVIERNQSPEQRPAAASCGRPNGSGPCEVLERNERPEQEQPAAAPRQPTRSARREVLERNEQQQQAASPRRQPARSARREVLERDGLRCSWRNEHGTRCEARGWLEHDHRHPLGKGGSSDPQNLRLLCRNHNRYAAEHEYGKAHVERALEHSRRKHRPPPAADCLAGDGGGHGG